MGYMLNPMLSTYVNAKHSAGVYLLFRSLRIHRDAVNHITYILRCWLRHVSPE